MQKKVVYVKPAILATVKNGSNFSTGCQTKSGFTCRQCKCS